MVVLASLLAGPQVADFLKLDKIYFGGKLFATPPQATAPMYGLEWPGTGATRRMLYWHNPFPIYDATYIFKVYPRKKTTGTYKYWTTFFWGNDGMFSWDNGNPNTYYGAHPYPRPAPSGAEQWEISVRGLDVTTGFEVDWERWHTQAFRAWRESAAKTRHEFYYDLPDTSKVISFTVDWTYWASKNPPVPAIVMGQAPDWNGNSWGGYPGWEEFNGIIRGIQMYSGLLSVSEIQSEIANPMSTTNGRNLIWYLNVNPRPSDVTDKKGIGTPHNPSWAGTPAFEWSDQGSSPADITPPSVSITAPAPNNTVQGVTAVTATAFDEVGVAGVQFKLDGINLSSEDTTSPYSINWDTSSATNGNHTLQAVARDAAGNQASSTAITVTVNNSDTTPPVISAVAASNITSSGATVTWSTNEQSDSQVQFGATTSYGSSTALDATRVASHSQTLTGLAASTTYNYRVLSRDAAGNLAASANFTFTTAAAPPSGGGTPPAGLIGYWKFDEGAGTVTADTSGSNNNGILSNGPAWSAGAEGNALSFAATDNANDNDDPRVVVGRTFDIPAAPFTMSTWVRPTDFGDWRAIFSKRDRYSSTSMRLDFGLAKTSGRVYMNSSRSYFLFSYAPPVNAWTHIAIVATSTSTALYVNGALVQTMGTFSLGSGSTANVVIGGTGEGSGGDNDPFKGSIDDLQIYNRALSAAEVQQLYMQ